MITVNKSEQQPVFETNDSDIVVSVKDVSKKFCRDLKRSLFYGLQDIVTEISGGDRQSDRLRKREFWALRDVNFQLRRGEALGLVGSNGAGKSTLLRIISGLIHPDTGIIQVKGRVAPLIALGAGFNPILTGRENIYANMSILGLPTSEIKRRFDDVVEFAEIADALDAPVQTYSSGMAARLGFACAIHIDPDVLLIDEVLAVGDIRFKMKCHHRLAKLREQGTAFVLVSHNPHSLLNVCNTSIYLKKGQLITSGETEAVMRQYEEDLCMSGTEAAIGTLFLPEKPKSESLGLDIRAIYFKDAAGNILDTPYTGEHTYWCVECDVHDYIEDANLGISATALSGENNRVFYLTSTSDQVPLNLAPGKVELQLEMPSLGLIPGVYTSHVYVRSGVRSYDIVKTFRFTVKSERLVSNCLYYQARNWNVVQKSR
uniref:ABC transporter ATP-binding protein n=1 Tax=Desertifilum tharense IPPAS B-1220 TaxID=1781255 RepID=A0ACD5H642_9CYAN